MATSSVSERSGSTTVTATCLCGHLSASAEVPNRDLPIDVWLCSCNTCRHLSGLLAVSAVYIHRPLTVEGKAERYVTSGGPKGLTRCFCGTCGTSVYEDSPSTEVLGLYSGALEHSQGLVKYRGQIYLSTTLDGGLSVWLPDLPGWELDFFGDFTKLFELPPNSYKKHTEAPPDKKLSCTCVCGGVQFDITRPSEESYKFHSLYSDTIAPHHQGDACKNTGDEKWWIRSNGTKYAACLCMCKLCTKSSGHDLQQWAFIPKVNILQKDGKPIDFSMGNLRHYSSSPGVLRHFCGTCSATVFWRSEERPDLIDVSVGLMESKSGSRAEDWLDWMLQRISFVEYAPNQELKHVLQAGLDNITAANPLPSLKASLPKRLETSRLTLSLFSNSEAEYQCVLDVLNGAISLQVQGDLNVRTPAQVDVLNHATRLDPSVTGKFPDIDLYYFARLKDQPDDRPIGAVSLAQRKKGIPPDIGWGFRDEYAGHGYATEAAKEMLRLVTEQMGVKEVMALPGSDNRRSIRVAEKIGLVPRGSAKRKEGGTTDTIYVLPGMRSLDGLELSLFGD